MTAFFLSLLLMTAMSGSSQVFFDNVEQVLALGKDSVISLAISNLERSGFSNIDLNQFDRLAAQTDGQDVKVIFNKSIHYIPEDTFVIHSAVVNIISKSVSWKPYGVKKSYEKTQQFYKYTIEDKRSIEFVLSDNHKIPSGTTITIHEYEDHYSVKEDSYKNGYAAEGGYKKDKLSGNKSGHWHMNSGTKNTGDGYTDIEW